MLTVYHCRSYSCNAELYMGDIKGAHSTPCGTVVIVLPVARSVHGCRHHLFEGMA